MYIKIKVLVVVSNWRQCVTAKPFKHKDLMHLNMELLELARGT